MTTKFVENGVQATASLNFPTAILATFASTGLLLGEGKEQIPSLAGSSSGNLFETVYYKPVSANSLDGIDQEGELSAFVEKLLGSTKDCPPEFNKVLNDHFWELV